jgi:hypothetical protein
MGTMKKETVNVLVLPPMIMAMAVVLVVLDPESLAASFICATLAFAASLACLVHGIRLLRADRSAVLICLFAALLYMGLLVTMCIPATAKRAAQHAARLHERTNGLYINLPAG